MIKDALISLATAVAGALILIGFGVLATRAFTGEFALHSWIIVYAVAFMPVTAVVIYRNQRKTAKEGENNE